MTTRALPAFLLIIVVALAAPAAQPPFSVGLYRDGQLVEQFVTAPAESTDPSNPQGRGHALAGLRAAAVQGAAGDRNQVFGESARLATALRDTLRAQLKAEGTGQPPDRETLRALLDRFIAQQTQVQSELELIGRRIAELSLAPEIQQRHLETVEAVQAGSEQLISLVEEVERGRPGALRDAVMSLEGIAFQREPDLNRQGPTRVPVPVVAAPERTRDEVDGGAAATQPMEGAGPGAMPSVRVLPVSRGLSAGPPTGGERPPGVSAAPGATIDTLRTQSQPVANRPSRTRAGAGPSRGGGASPVSSRVARLQALEAPLSSPPGPADLLPTLDVQITPEISAKVAELGSSPIRIYEFVRNAVRFQAYLGSRKGSAFTLQQLAGNDTDQASLLIAMLRAAGIPSRYVRGTVELTPEQAMAWTGLDEPRTAASLLTTAGLDGLAIVNGPDVVAVRCTRVWVEAWVPYSNYRGVPNDDTGKGWVPLDPAFKENAVTPGEDVLAAMGFDTDAYLADYIATVRAQSPLEKLQADIQAWLDVNRPGKTVADIERTLSIRELNLGLLPASLPYQLVSVSGRLSELEASKRYHVRFHLHDGGTTFLDYTISLPELITKRLTVDYVGATPSDQQTIDGFGGIYETPPNLVNVVPRLKLDGVAVATSVNFSRMGYTHDWDMHFLQPSGDQNQQPVSSNEIIAGNGQAVAFDTFLDVPLGDLSTSDTDPNLLESTLTDTAREYLHRVDTGEDVASRLMRMVALVDVSEAIVENSIKVTYSLSVPVTFEWTGLIVDADRRIVGPFAADGSAGKSVPFMKLTGYDGSNMENRVYEDTFQQEAVSTIKILQLANDWGVGVCTIRTSIAADCPGFAQSSLVSTINNALQRGHEVTVPKASITVGQWIGTGYIDMDPGTGAAGYIIAGGISGNVSVAGGATVESWPVFLPCWFPTVRNDPGDPIKTYYDGSSAPITDFCGCDTRHIRLKGKFAVKCGSKPETQQPFNKVMTLSIKQIADDPRFGGGNYELRLLSTVLVRFRIASLELKGLEFTSDHGVLTDYSADYAGSGGNVYSPRGWTSAGENNPITHTRDSLVSARATLIVKPSGVTVSVLGDSPLDALDFRPPPITGTGVEQSVSVDSQQKLPKTIGVESNEIEWSLRMADGTERKCVKSGPHVIYVLWAPPGVGPTMKRVFWSVAIAAGADTKVGAAERFRDTLSVTPGYQPPRHYTLDSWGFLDSGRSGDCITLAKLAAEGLRMVGIPAQERWAYPTADGTVGFPQVSSSSCTAKARKTFQYNGETFVAKLVYPGNNFEAFFTIVDGGVRAYTVYPAGGPFTGPLFYLEVLRSVATDQFWVWDGDQTVGGVSVLDWDPVPGAPHIPVP